jgi:hypothetical protein
MGSGVGGVGTTGAAGTTGGGVEGTWAFGLDPQAAVNAVTKATPAAATVGSQARFIMRGRSGTLCLAGEVRITPGSVMVNPNPNLLNRKHENIPESAGPVGRDEQMVLLAEVPGGGGHDGPLADNELATLAQRLPHVVLADKLQGL